MSDELGPLGARLAKGRAKYPAGCTVLSLLDEAGEVAHAVNKRESIERVRDELLDVAAVAMRLYFGEIDTVWQPTFGPAAPCASPVEKRACGCDWNGPPCDHERIHKETSKVLATHPLVTSDARQTTETNQKVPKTMKLVEMGEMHGMSDPMPFAGLMLSCSEQECRDAAPLLNKPVALLAADDPRLATGDPQPTPQQSQKVVSEVKSDVRHATEEEWRELAYFRARRSSDGPWRTGRKIGNTVYIGETFAGSCVDPKMATMLVAAANIGTITDWDERRASEAARPFTSEQLGVIAANAARDEELPPHGQPRSAEETLVFGNKVKSEHCVRYGGPCTGGPDEACGECSGMSAVADQAKRRAGEIRKPTPGMAQADCRDCNGAVACEQHRLTNENVIAAALRLVFDEVGVACATVEAEHGSDSMLSAGARECLRRIASIRSRTLVRERDQANERGELSVGVRGVVRVTDPGVPVGGGDARGVDVHGVAPSVTPNACPPPKRTCDEAGCRAPDSGECATKGCLVERLMQVKSADSSCKAETIFDTLDSDGLRAPLELKRKLWKAAEQAGKGQWWNVMAWLDDAQKTARTECRATLFTSSVPKEKP